MEITSRYSDEFDLDESTVPEQFRHLIPLAKEWSISDDEELDAYIEAASPEKRREFVDAFQPHFDGLYEWHKRCEELTPHPDECVLFDTAANAAATVQSLLEE
jgi:hypothetical protein